MGNIRRSLGLLAVYGLFSCSSPTAEQKQATQKPYFDLKAYFEKQAMELSDGGTLVEKTVYKNEEKETRRFKLGDWKDEFEFFTSSDINKPDWLHSYAKDSSAYQTVYTSDDPKLRTKKIIIFRNTDNQVAHIAITNRDKNWLYESIEDLDYYPDSMYNIRKKQVIRFIGTNNYQVIGKFIHSSKK